MFHSQICLCQISLLHFWGDKRNKIPSSPTAISNGLGIPSFEWFLQHCSELFQLRGVDLDNHSERTPSNLFAVHCHCQIMSAPHTTSEGDGVSFSISGKLLMLVQHKTNQPMTSAVPVHWYLPTVAL